MSKWNTSETGILRKKVIPENHEDLLVFGYACKLFRDDEKAKYIDQGKHLIPWMGSDGLRIDRYDCRGALSDLSSYEASREGYDAMRWLGLSESERKIEQLCDEERYHALHSNQEDDEMYREEELKRLQQKTNEFAYSYDVPQNPQIPQENIAPTCEEEDKEYVPKPELNVPADITIPKTEKENARIEKTATFVCKQGPQMEILIKTKQANNPQFSFLNQSDPLYKYYKHVLNALKTGTYKVESSSQDEERKDSVEQESSDEHYLHPSLLQPSVQTPLPTIPTVTYKPTADCSYSQLVNRIQGSQTDNAAAQSKNENEQIPAQDHVNYEQQQQQYYQYYYAMQYYEYYKQLVQQFHNMGGTDGQTIPPLIQEQINAQATAFAQMAYTQYIQQHQQHHQNNTNPYSQIVSNVSQAKENMYPPLTNIADTGQIRDITKAPIIYNNQPEPVIPTFEHAVTAQPQNQPIVENQKKLVEVPKITKKPLLSLVHYGSDSEESEDENSDKEKDVVKDESFKMPPDDVKVIIDKMASYVAKNGGDFENIVKSKGDSRFEFLKDDHEYHGYYKHKIKEFNPKVANEVKEIVRTVQNGVQPKAKDKKVIAPVSFSIKKPKEEIPKDIKSALPIEESDEETPETPPSTSNSKDNPTKPVDTTNTNPSTTPIPQNTKEIPKETEIPIKETSPVTKTKDPQDKKPENIAADDPILEMIDLTEDLEEKKDAKRAEDRIKDKLAAAAREKLASVTKDRALQIERKKKAAAFLKLKSVENDKSKPQVKKDEKEEKEDKVLVISDGDSKIENVNEKSSRRSKSKTRESTKESKKEESDPEEGEIKKHKKSSKKKKTHKRKRSRSRHRSKSHYKKVKKRRRRSDSYESSSSDD